MRITQQMLHQNSVRHMNQNLSRFEKANNQLSSGTKLNRPSDDPNGVSKAMNLKSALAANGQYERNTTEAKLWMDETDQTIGKMVDVMQRVRELAVRGNNETLSESDRKIIATELNELTDQMHRFANAQVNGNYLFNGTDTKQPPFPDENSFLIDSFNTGAKTFPIADGVSIKANVTANELFGSAAEGTSIFQMLNEVSAKIESGETVDLDQIDTGMDRMLQATAENGARTNRLEAIENRVADSTIQLKSMLSKIEDVDYAEAIIRLKSEESVYQASLSSSAKIIQPSLMDFLR